MLCLLFVEFVDMFVVVFVVVAVCVVLFVLVVVGDWCVLWSLL